MWVFFNNAMISVVQDPVRPLILVARARCEGDLERVFGDVKVIVDEARDYRFRTFITKGTLKEIMIRKIDEIDYPNFKDSVEEKDRKWAYQGVWAEMFDLQEKRHPQPKSWWETYRYYDQIALGESQRTILNGPKSHK